MIRVEFITKDGFAKYDPDTSSYTEDLPETVVKYCHVHDLTEEKTAEIFGNVKTRALRVYHAGSLVKADKATVRGTTYHVTNNRQLRNKATYVLTEEMISG